MPKGIKGFQKGHHSKSEFKKGQNSHQLKYALKGKNILIGKVAYLQIQII